MMELHLMHLMVHQIHVQQQEVAVVDSARVSVQGGMVVLVVVLEITRPITLAALLLVPLVDQVAAILHLLAGEMMVATCRTLVITLITQQQAAVVLEALVQPELTALHLVVLAVMV